MTSTPCCFRASKHDPGDGALPGQVFARNGGEGGDPGGEAFPHTMPIKSEVKYFYDTGCYDYYIQGYGEVPLIDLNALDNGDPLDKVNGLVYFGGDAG